MPSTPLVPAPLDLDHIREAVDTTLDGFLDSLAADVPRPRLAPLVHTLRCFVSAGGKRVRPLLCVVGWHAAGGFGGQSAVLSLAASLELLHASVLIHDDLIDDSDTRRGAPTAHRSLAAHRAAERAQDAGRFGASAALLLGDLTLVWSDQLLRAGRLTRYELDAVLPVVDATRRDVLIGQYLDLLGTGTPSDDLDAALTITRYKTAHYTVERPLQAGVALAGGSARMLRACAEFGLPLGEAFQLRDDLLGVFGDAAHTGKPVLDDLREGKHTPLVALALARATPAQRAVLTGHLGRAGLTEDDAAEVRGILVSTGARDTVEEMIDVRHRQALAALDRSGFRPAAVQALRTLSDAAVRRSS